MKKYISNKFVFYLLFYIDRIITLSLFFTNVQKTPVFFRFYHISHIEEQKTVVNQEIVVTSHPCMLISFFFIFGKNVVALLQFTRTHQMILCTNRIWREPLHGSRSRPKISQVYTVHGIPQRRS